MFEKSAWNRDSFGNRSESFRQPFVINLLAHFIISARNRKVFLVTEAIAYYLHVIATDF